jgi:hypothetical protein
MERTKLVWQKPTLGFFRMFEALREVLPQEKEERINAFVDKLKETKEADPAASGTDKYPLSPERERAMRQQVCILVTMFPYVWVCQESVILCWFSRPKRRNHWHAPICTFNLTDSQGCQ